MSRAQAIFKAFRRLGKSATVTGWRIAMHRSFEPGWIGGRLCLAVALIAMIASCSPSSAPNSNAGPPVTIKVWDWNAGESYYKQGFDNFNKQHSNIKVEYTFQQSSTFSTVVQSAFQSGAAPDIFMSYFAPMADLMSKGWVQPIGNATDSDVAAWMKTFPADSFKSNIHVFDGKVYSFPYLPQGTIYLYYNKTVLQAAGVSEPPKTWSELRADAKKVTQSSGGKSYGLVTGGKDNWPWFMNVSYLAATAGACTDGVLGAPPIAFDYSKGQYHPNNPATAAAIQLWLDMQRKGTTIPRIDSLTDADAHAAFGNGKAAFFFSGNWTPSVLSHVAPTADFGVAPLPLPDSGPTGYMLLDPAGRTWVISSKTKSRGAAFEVIKYMTSLPFH